MFVTKDECDWMILNPNMTLLIFRFKSRMWSGSVNHRLVVSLDPKSVNLSCWHNKFLKCISNRFSAWKWLGIPTEYGLVEQLSN